MADTTIPAGLRKQQWERDFFKEYVRENRFASYMGTNENAIIQMRENLGKGKGDRITFSLVNRLTNGGVQGSAILEGNEEEMVSRSHRLTVDKFRNAVRVAEMEEVKSAIDLMNAARSTLKDWALEHTRGRVIGALSSFRDGETQYRWTTSAEFDAIAEAVKDAWLVDNADRTLFGASTSNNASNDYSAALAQIDNTNDKLTSANIALAKRMAQVCNPKIKPIRTKGDEEWYVLFAHSYQIRDLVQSDSAFLAANREARDRGKDNPLFRGADYVWNGVIIREIPELPLIASGVDGAAVQVGTAFLCGAQALGYGLAKRWTAKTKDDFDYGDKVGVAIEQIYDVEKLCFGSGASDTDDQKQHGVVTIHTAAVAD